MNEIEGHRFFGENEPLKQAVTYLQTLLPKVTSHLAENKRFNDLITFLTLLSADNSV